MKSQLFLIPTTLGGDEVSLVIPNDVIDIVKNLRIFFVEEIKSARRFLRKVDRNFPIDDCTFYNIGKKNKKDYLQTLLTISENKYDFGVMSEAGCPGVADPGAMIASLSHDLNIHVTPLVGPSSILLALMASGFSGQNFSFHGYLPKERNHRIKKIKEMEIDSRKNKRTNIFMDTPFRNMHVLEDVLSSLNKDTLLSVSCNLTLPDALSKTMSIEKWKKTNYNFNKKPALFIIGQYH
tara:strand:+ start:287 stop:997 length:711 start_codon:yes stop_codon:yes gene_type:complete